jgi:hypothetical protein
MADFIDWPTSGHKYRYWFLSNPSTASGIKSEAGNYMFVKPTNNGWVPVYIGIADNLSERIPCHDRAPEAAKLGATRVMAHTSDNQAAREAEERDLIGYWNPPLNLQLRTARASRFGGSGF